MLNRTQGRAFVAVAVLCAFALGPLRPCVRKCGLHGDSSRCKPVHEAHDFVEEGAGFAGVAVEQDIVGWVQQFAGQRHTGAAEEILRPLGLIGPHAETQIATGQARALEDANAFVKQQPFDLAAREAPEDAAQLTPEPDAPTASA